MIDIDQLTYTSEDIHELRKQITEENNRIYNSQVELDEKVLKLIEMREVYKKETEYTTEHSAPKELENK